MIFLKEFMKDVVTVAFIIGYFIITIVAFALNDYLKSTFCAIMTVVFIIFRIKDMQYDALFRQYNDLLCWLSVCCRKKEEGEVEDE